MHIMRPVPPFATGKALVTALHGLPKYRADPALPQPSSRIFEGSQPHPEQTQKSLLGYKIRDLQKTAPVPKSPHTAWSTLLPPPFYGQKFPSLGESIVPHSNTSGKHNAFSLPVVNNLVFIRQTFVVC